MRVYLKVKVASLAAEARIIRRLERQHRDRARQLAALQKPNSKMLDLRAGLYHHRVNVVRPEARASHLALGYLRGRSYAEMEGRAKTAPRWARIIELIRVHGDIRDTETITNAVVEWRKMPPPPVMAVEATAAQSR
jgi:hypothetical protein